MTSGAKPVSLMRWGFVVAAIALLFLTPGAALGHHSPDHQRGPRSGTTVEDQYIVMLRPGASGEAVRRAYEVANPRGFSRAFNGFTGRIPKGRLNALRNDPRVEEVIPDRLLKGEPGPPGRTKKGGPSTSAERVPSSVSRIGAAPTANLGFTGDGIGVAIIDSGIDRNHVDLSVSAACFDAFGGDCSDSSGHGTHVAGIVAALKNGIGVVGVAPSATVYAVKVLDAEQGGGDSKLLAGLEWVLSNAKSVSPPIKIANLSLGRPGKTEDNRALRSAIDALLDTGIVVVTSAGNDPDVSASAQVPAAYREVITVASSVARSGSNSCTSAASAIPSDTLSYFSSFAPRTGDDGVDVIAPGERQENIDAACVIENVGVLSLYPGDSLAEMSGTSMAAPLVSGVAALLLERNPALTPAQVADAIRNGASATARASVLGIEPAGVAVLSAPGALAAAP